MEEALIVLVCLVLNALFAAFEMAFVSVARSDLRKLARQGSKDATKLLQLRDHPERTLSIIQIGITLVGALAAAVGGAGASESIEPWLKETLKSNNFIAETLSLAIVVVPLTYLSVVVGELVPKSLALRNPLKITLAGAKTLSFADRVFSPVVTVLEASTKILLNFFFKKSKTPEVSSHSTIEIDALSETHQQFVINLTHLESKKMGEILLPWAKVTYVKHDDELDTVASVILSSGHTRLPVVGISGIVGILHTKEFLAYRESGEKDWKSLIRPALKIQDHFSVLGTLRLMQEKRCHMAIVYSTMSEELGIVTIEDILEEVVGEIYDEDDDGRVKKIFTSRVKNRPLVQ